jgi:glucose 1-dehydrogenase
MGLLDGKVAVITGGTRGIGLSIARAFARSGASVVVASRSQKSVDEAVQLIQKENGQASGMAMDVSNLAQVQELAEFAIKHFGGFDIWVNNAGTAGPYGPTVGYEPKDFLQVVQTNILGVYNGSRTAMQYFLERRSGKLINILGRGFKGPTPWQNAYGSSKAWVLSFTMALAEETRESGVGVFAFNPGMVLTDLLTKLDVIEGSENRLINFPTVLRMWAKPAEIPAKKVVWIASSETDGKTGLLIRAFSPWVVVKGMLNERVRVLLRKPAPDIELRINVIPPYKG